MDIYPLLYPPSSPAPSVRLLLVGFRSGEAVARHPELTAWLKQDWTIRTARPRITPDGAKLLVVMTHSLSSPPCPHQEHAPAFGPLQAA